ncbi:MAG: hypothetical protein ABWX65_01315 [Mycetocola sp.]
MASLIQQRMAIERQRTFGLIFLVLGGVSLPVAIIVTVASSSSWIPWIQIVVALVWIGLGLLGLLRYRREVGTFTGEHGVDAGKR